MLFKEKVRNVYIYTVAVGTKQLALKWFRLMRVRPCIVNMWK